MTSWSDHVKRFAKKHKMSYREASMSSKCKESYQKKKKMSPRRMKMPGPDGGGRPPKAAPRPPKAAPRSTSGGGGGGGRGGGGRGGGGDPPRSTSGGGGRGEISTDIMPCPGNCNEGFDCETCSDEGDKPCRTLCELSKDFRLSVRLDKLFEKKFKQPGKYPNFVYRFTLARSFIRSIEDEERKVFPLRVRLLTENNIDEELLNELESRENKIEENKKKVLKLLRSSEADL